MGILHDADSTELIILCHGLQSSKVVGLDSNGLTFQQYTFEHVYLPLLVFAMHNGLIANGEQLIC